MATPRSLLFAPGDDARRSAKAIAAGAGCAVIDLEDAVAEARKDLARDTVAQTLRARAPGGGRVAVRINGFDTPHAAADLEMAVRCGADAIVVPKARAESLRALDAGRLPPLIAIIETAAGLQESGAVAACPGVRWLLLGAVDLGQELRLTPRADGLELLFARSKLVMDSAAAGIDAPIDVVHVELDAPEALAAQCELACSLGFGGKACIHPRQLEIVERAFAPTPEQVDHAHRVVREFEAALARDDGVVSLGGEMVDRPVYERALNIINDTRTDT